MERESELVSVGLSRGRTSEHGQGRLDRGVPSAPILQEVGGRHSHDSTVKETSKEIDLTT